MNPHLPSFLTIVSIQVFLHVWALLEFNTHSSCPVFALPRCSRDWRRPTHSGKANLPYYTDSNANLIQKHCHRHTQEYCLNLNMPWHKLTCKIDHIIWNTQEMKICVRNNSDRYWRHLVEFGENIYCIIFILCKYGKNISI